MEIYRNDQVANEPDEYLDYQGLSRFLKLSVRTLRNWKSAGRLPFTRMHGKVLFSRKEIIKILKKNNVKTAEELFYDWRDNQTVGSAEQDHFSQHTNYSKFSSVKNPKSEHSNAVFRKGVKVE